MFLTKVQITQKKIIFPKLFFVNYLGWVPGAHCNIFFVKIKNSKDIFGS